VIAHSQHPLFPYDLEDEPDQGEEITEIAHVCVTRFDATTNKYVWALDTYKADELTSLNQLFELYGGGKYELFAKTDYQGRPGSTICRVRYDLAGAPKPLAPGDTMGRAAATPPASSSADAAGVAGAGTTSMDRLLMMMLQGQQQSTQLMVAMLQTMGQTMAAAMSSRGGGSDASAVALGQIAVAAMNRPVPETPVQAFKDALQMGLDMAGGDGGGEEDESVAEEILKGLSAVKEMANMTGPAVVPGQVPPPRQPVNHNAPAHQTRPPSPPAKTA